MLVAHTWLVHRLLAHVSRDMARISRHPSTQRHAPLVCIYGVRGLTVGRSNGSEVWQRIILPFCACILLNAVRISEAPYAARSVRRGSPLVASSCYTIVSISTCLGDSALSCHEVREKTCPIRSQSHGGVYEPNYPYPITLLSFQSFLLSSETWTCLAAVSS